jgi:inhibitor of KinA
MKEILPFGDNALLVNFDQIISEEVNAEVHWLNHKLLAKQSELGIKYTIPAYSSLTVVFHPIIASFQKLSQQISEVWKSKQNQISESEKPRLLNIPVCYDNEFGLDIKEVSKQTGLQANEIKAYHFGKRYKVFMLGFTPGFAFMGVLDEILICHRKANPRLKVPLGSVGLAGSQTGIYPSATPGGWQIIGRTPLPLINSNKKNPFLFSPGDQVSFYEISKSEFEGFNPQVPLKKLIESE